MKIPGPDHPITIVRNPRRVVVRANGRAIADTNDALTLREAKYAPVHYVPRADVDMTRLVRTERVTTCPFKGAAAYYSIDGNSGAAIENAAWTYETPHAAVAEIAGHIAFYPSRVESISELDV